MAMVIDAMSWLLLVGGSLMLLVGSLGILRLPDVFARMHGLGIIDTLGAGLVILGLMVQAGASLVAVKLVLLGVFIFFTSPTTTHALARACLNGGVTPTLRDQGETRDQA